MNQTKSPTYCYIRDTDRLPTIAQAIALEDREDFAGHVARVKLFMPEGSWTWYVLAYDPDTRMAYCLVDGDFAEYGDVSLDEIESLRGPVLRLPVERDLHFAPTNARQLKTHATF